MSDVLLNDGISDKIAKTFRFGKNVTADTPFDLSKSVKEIKKRSILFALKREGPLVSKAAQYLNLKRTTFIERMRAFEISVEDEFSPLEAFSDSLGVSRLEYDCLMIHDDYMTSRQECFDVNKFCEDFEREVISRSVHFTKGDVAFSARLLSLRRTTLVEKMKRYFTAENFTEFSNLRRGRVEDVNQQTVSAVTRFALGPERLILPQAAELLGIDRRTLQRRLEVMGTSVRQIKQEL